VIEAQASGLPVVGVASGAMVDRILPTAGRLGPVDDSAAMARNIAAIWSGDPVGMGRVAREHVRDRFAWDQSMATLFGSVYSRAFAVRAGAADSIAVAAGRALADA